MILSEPIHNALTIDVEDCFQVAAFAPHIARETWDRMPCRVERNVDAILVMFDEHKALLEDIGGVATRSIPGTACSSSCGSGRRCRSPTGSARSSHVVWGDR